MTAVGSKQCCLLLAQDKGIECGAQCCGSCLNEWPFLMETDGYFLPEGLQ